MDYIKVKELFKITKGKKVEEIDYKNENSIRYIQIDDLRNNNNIKHCENINKYVIAKKEDIIIAWDGANAGTIGFGIEGAIGSTLAILRKENKEMDTEFCGLFLRSKSAYLREKCTGATIPHIQRTALEDIEIPKIPLNKQIEIKNIINKSQELIDKRKEQIEALDELVKSKFIEMFGDPVSNPMNWEKKRLADECNIITGNTPSRKVEGYYGDYIEWIKSDNITDAGIYLTKAREYLSEEGLKVGRSVEENSILMTCIAGSIKCIGNVAIANRKVTFNQQINGIEPLKNNVYFMFEQFNLSQKYIQSTINMSLKGILSKGQLSELEFIFPPIEKQDEFAEFFKQVDKLKFEMEKSLKELEDNFNSLMQKAFNGELFI